MVDKLYVGNHLVNQHPPPTESATTPGWSHRYAPLIMEPPQAHPVMCPTTRPLYRRVNNSCHHIPLVFLLQTSKSAIGSTGFVLPMPFRFRKHKGHDLSYDVNIMTSQQRLSRIVTSTFL